ncbi:MULTISPECIES: phage tail protein [unclassified Paenibacillus]|uniref:phage tail protein n=1 Tax=unclassified Paenibacillus TaxID=185978 RepID=UPI0006FF3D93|nr:tail fiber protein [Paenibacillus sp. Soil750]KRE60367.1 phage tail protein [Paenibacillus sp. Soil750]
MDQFLGEIRIFPFNFAPTGWVQCNGQILPIQQYAALFSLLGTMYGGNGSTNFALPDLQGRVPLHPGQGAGLSQYDIGQSAGEKTVTLLPSEIPAHTHAIQYGTSGFAQESPTGQLLMDIQGRRGAAAYTEMTNLKPMGAQAVAPTGNSQPHNNMQPYLTLNFCIATQGIFPSRY